MAAQKGGNPAVRVAAPLSAFRCPEKLSQGRVTQQGESAGMFGPALEAAEYAVASLEARIDRRIGVAARLAIGRYLTVIAIGIPVAWVVCDFKLTRDGMLGIAAGAVLFAMLRPFASRARKP